MTFDATLPSSLKKTQVWFASIITRPIDINSCMEPLSPSGRPMVEEAKDFIKPSPTLNSAQRIELYNQQYWWRLLTIMQENFPFLARLFGYHDFNMAIAVPYLQNYPSSHWSLNRLGEKIIPWINEEYAATDKELVHIAASIDWAYCDIFSAPQFTPLTLENLPIPNDMNSLLSATLYLQPHIKLFKFHSDYFDLRFEMLKQSVDYWQDHDFPELKKSQGPYYFMLFRNYQLDLAWNYLSEAEYLFLKRLQKGSSIDSCCDWLEKENNPALSEASDHISEWLKSWVANQWLTLEKK